MNNFVHLLMLGVTLFYVSVAAQDAGGCQRLMTIKNFNPQKIAGDWYVQEFTKTEFDVELRCAMYKFTPSTPKNWTINFSVYVPMINMTLKGTNKATIGDTRDGTAMIATINGVTSYRYILATDYSRYFIFYDCVDIGNGQQDDSMEILTRDARPKPDVLKDAYAAIDASNAGRDEMSKVKNENCAALMRGSVESSIIPAGVTKLLGILYK